MPSFLPDRPLTTRWLNEEERQLAHNRLLRDKVDTSGNGSTWDGLKQAVSDPRVWVFCLAQNLHLSANGFKNFFPVRWSTQDILLSAETSTQSVIKSLGFNQTITLVLTCPPYLVAGFFSIAVCKYSLLSRLGLPLRSSSALTSGKYNERTWHITGCKLFAILGFALAPATLNVGVRYAAMCIFTIGMIPGVLECGLAYMCLPL